MTRRLNNDGTWDDPQAPLATPGLDPYANQIGLRLGGGGVIPFGASALTVGILGDSIVQDGWAYGGVATVSNLVGGSGYVNGTYSNVPLTGGTGAGATANITVAGGAVTSVAIVSPGNAGYQISGILSASNAALGNSGSGFNCYVQTLSAPVLNPVTSMVAGGSTNFVNWAAAYSMGKIRYTAVWAQGGFKVSQILDNLTALYVPFLPDITIVQIGFNDISGVTNDVDTAGIVASFQSSLINLIGKLKALGTTPILCTISPKNSNFGGFNKLNNKWIGIHNQWVRNYCASNRLGMFDYANYVSDPSDTVNGGPFLPLFQGLGGILSFGAITAGSLYTNGTYYGVPMTGGSGTGANANITVAGGAVTSVVVSASSGGSVGRLYNVGDSLTCSAAAIGGTGSGFSVLVGSIGSSHVHGGGELNRALGYELWNGTLSKLATSSYVANYNGLASNGNDTYTYPAGVNLAVGYNTAGTAMLTGTAGTVTGPATGTIPTGLQSWGAAGSTAVYSIVAATGAALSTLDTSLLAGGGAPGNWAQCAIDTNNPANLYTLNQGVGFQIPINFSYGGKIALPQQVVVRVRVKTTSLANCAGIFMRVSGGTSGFVHMSPNSQGLAPTFQEAANVTTNFDVLYQTAPFTIPNGGGNSLSISIGAAITKTAPGTTTFSISQPELILVPVRTA